MRFHEGDRVIVVGAFITGARGEVVRVHGEGAYGVLFDEPEHQGPLADGAIFMEDAELQFEEDAI